MIIKSTSSTKTVHDIYTIALLISDFQLYMYARTLDVVYSERVNIQDIFIDIFLFFTRKNS